MVYLCIMMYLGIVNFKFLDEILRVKYKLK